MFQRMLVSGGKAVTLLGEAGCSLYTNLVLLQRDRIIKEFPSTVPQDQCFLLRNADLPTGAQLFPTDPAITALEKKHAAAQDALFLQVLTSRAAPRALPATKVPKSQVARSTVAPPGAGVSPVVPKGTAGSSSAPTPSTESRKKRKRRGKRGNFRGTGRPAQSGGSRKGNRA